MKSVKLGGDITRVRMVIIHRPGGTRSWGNSKRDDRYSVATDVAARGLDIKNVTHVTTTAFRKP
jgi:hypothetical protein